MNTQNPVFNGNRMKLGTFCTNGKGPNLTTVPESYMATWPDTRKLAQMADVAGFEAIVPYSRWKGFVTGQPDDRTGNVMDPFTWAAAISASTRYSAIFSTSHAPTYHPIVAAKQCATIDIISNGRFGLNVVGGWNRPELEMFGRPLQEHDQRYDYLGEWLEIVSRLWQSDVAFDHHGKFFNVVDAVSAPKPVQRPRPPIMNAGGSPRGVRFAAQHADMCFVVLKGDDPATIAAQVNEYKDLARQEFGREVQVWSSAYVVQGETDEQAQAYLHRYSVEHEDSVAADAWLKALAAEAQLMPPEALKAARSRFVAGAGGFPLVGTPETIVKRLSLLADGGIDGVVLTWVDFMDGLARFTRDVLPLMEAAGLRSKFGGGDVLAA
ncbi:LLM class flavin-dependent oxidoreductase [Novosphingobium kaempferiae]|uniref:LLM class flavin-dependent oxidoreductase n=1 Tax=Novosphingobium kaempferiae TaxID=2896849 RepID=UPI001E3F3F68|nr:LLM class flavin-dependent oxidoreductase [Novosphingobium kaempferiae]